MSSEKIVPLRPRGEVSRGATRLPPKSRRRYKRHSAHRYRNLGRFQRPMRWAVLGKLIVADWRWVQVRDPRNPDAPLEDDQEEAQGGSPPAA